jgi:hypothetical protein
MLTSSSVAFPSCGQALVLHNLPQIWKSPKAWTWDHLVRDELAQRCVITPVFPQ